MGAIGSAVAGVPADVLIQGGTVYSGADASPSNYDVVITGDKIVYVGPDGAKRYEAREVVNAEGKIVAPGFIDVHTHPETYVRSEDAKQRLNAPWLFQGATTLFIGVDGYGSPDVSKERALFERQGIGTNLVPYVGFGAVRKQVLHEEDRAPSSVELNEMRKLVAKGMCEGAIGFSTGLFYAPQSFAKTDEVIALAKEAAARGGIYDTHQRDESSYSIGLLGSVNEVLQIGREAAIPVHFAHIKALGVDVQGQAPQVIAAIDAARKAGQDVTADQYPWNASGSDLESSLLPRWAVDGGRSALLKRLDSAAQLEKIRAEMLQNLRRRGGADSLLMTSANTPWTGKTLSQMAQSWKVEPIDAALRIIRSGKGTAVASFNMSENDIRLFMRQPWVVTSSDGSDGHPRQYATFPMKYAMYVQKDKVISMNEFVRSSTGRSADMFKLDRRGYLREGYFADVVVFDPARFAPKADYLHPRVLSEGVDELWVNGQPAIHAGKLTGQAAGRVLLHTPPAGSCR
ncbi:MAG TPA: amidohydrolase family protein [Steroidobacteraceae bacterium]|nr:amidohydrolase family protein [Steroidobacteraceae bacterium]